MRPLVAALAVVAATLSVTPGCGSDDGGKLTPPPDRGVNGTEVAGEPIDPSGSTASAGTPNVAVEQQPFGATGSTDAVVLRRHTVFDPASNGIAAMSLLVPSGWEASGEVQWLPLWARLAFLQTRVRDPLTGLTINWLPIQNFMYFTPPARFEVPIGGNYQGKSFMPPITDPLQFVREFWMPDTLSHLQNATVMGVQEQPMIAQDFIRGFGGSADAGAWRIRYEYGVDGVV